MDYWGGPKGMLAPPPLKLLGGPGPPSSYAYVRDRNLSIHEVDSTACSLQSFISTAPCPDITEFVKYVVNYYSKGSVIRPPVEHSRVQCINGLYNSWVKNITFITSWRCLAHYMYIHQTKGPLK